METQNNDDENVNEIRATMEVLKNGIELSIEKPNRIIVIPSNNELSE